MTNNSREEHSRETRRVIELELAKLRAKLWKARGRHTRITGATFLFISGLFLILAYITRYLVFEITSILALLLGVVFVFTSVEPYLKANVANKAVISALMPLASVLNYLQVKSKAVYLPPASGKSSQRTFLPAQSGLSLPTYDEIERDDSVTFLQKGILLPSTGGALRQLYEEELGNLRNFDLEYLMAWLPKILVDSLKIAERVVIDQKTTEIQVKVTESAFRHLCQQPSVKIVCETIGCPLCSSLGEAISKNTSQIVYYMGCEYKPLTHETDIIYRIGPSLETLKQKNEAGARIDTS